MSKKLSNTAIVIITFVLVVIIKLFMDLFTVQSFWVSRIWPIILPLPVTVFVYFNMWIDTLLIYFGTRQRGNPTTPLIHLLMIAATPFNIFYIFFYHDNIAVIYWLGTLMLIYDVMDFVKIIGIYPRVGKMKNNKLFYAKLYARRCLWIIVKNISMFMTFASLVLYILKWVGY